MKYSYMAYGITIESNIKLPLVDARCLVKSDNRLFVSQQSINTQVKLDASIGSMKYHLSDQIKLFDIPNIARYLIIDNKSVSIEPYPDSDERIVNLYFIHIVLLFLFHTSDLLLFHGSAVVLPSDFGAIILIGNKEAGKSTIAAALTFLGSKILCDDIIPIRSGPRVEPGIPLIKLLPDSHKVLVGIKASLNDFSDGVGKYHTELPYSVKSSALQALYIIEPCEQDHVTIRESSGSKKINGILKQTIRIDEYDSDETLFRKLVAYCNQIPVYEVKRPAGFIDPLGVAKIIMEHAISKNKKGY